ncbi:hypothetical protein OFM04_33350, partial [Escherichia coli]|nr:hypothetical protein [Escherichia coli]
YLHFLPSGKVKARRILLVGGGDRNDFNLPAVSRAAGTAVRFLRKNKIRSFALDPRLTEPAAAIAEAAVQGFITGQFELDKYRTKDI